MMITERIQPNLVTIDQLDAEDALDLIHEAQAYKAGKTVELKRPAYAMNLFFEDSTRTKSSFQMAQLKLGMKIINFNAQTSSVNKGESLYDTLKTIESIGVDIAVIRHSENNYYRDLLKNHHLNIGIVNAGDGSGQHPSQCLLDMMTIAEQFHCFHDLKVLIVGDISHSRVARSNAQMLTRLGAKVYFAGPKQWFDDAFTQYGEYGELDDLLPQMDVVNLLRIQNERLGADIEVDTGDYHERYGLTKARYDQMKEKTIIIHPAPVNRGVEIDSDLVESPKSRIFTQMENGVFVRMAILSRILRYRKAL